LAYITVDPRYGPVKDKPQASYKSAEDIANKAYEKAYSSIILRECSTTCKYSQQCDKRITQYLQKDAFKSFWNNKLGVRLTMAERKKKVEEIFNNAWHNDHFIFFAENPFTVGFLQQTHVLFMGSR
jgi:hypothetical protein